MQRWDDYVDDSLSYLKHQFQLKFFADHSHEKFFTLMNFIDILSLSYDARQYCPRKLVACVMYLVIGGKDIMCAFQMEYHEMKDQFQAQFPIESEGKETRLPEGIVFYNQIIQPFFVNEFGYYLTDLIEPLKFVLNFFILNIDQNRVPPIGAQTVGQHAAGGAGADNDVIVVHDASPNILARAFLF